jgi:hypothetical protein
MKKTIAKLMAAAMMLSAVPAVTLPSFVSKADQIAVTNTSTATYADQFLGGEGTRSTATKGELFAFVLPTGTTIGNFAVGTASVDSAVATGIKLELKQDSNNLVHVVASMDNSKMSSSQKTDFINAVRNGKNTFRVKLTRKRSADNVTLPAGTKQYTVKVNGTNYPFQFTNRTTVDLDALDKSDNNITLDAAAKEAIMFQDDFTWTSQKTYSIGGVYENGKIKSGVFDTDGYLADRNVYAKISKVTSDGIAEVELLKQDKNEANKLKDNDTLRGQKLTLNTIWISGVEYKVGKLGSQVLKEAKMKKIELKNCSKVGKGAMRKCKQLRNVNLKDKNKVRKIHAKAFYDCKNLKNISIDARKLNTVGTDSFTKVKKNCRIKLKANKSKYNDVVKKIKKANKKNTTLKFARIAP